MRKNTAEKEEKGLGDDLKKMIAIIKDPAHKYHK